MENAECGMRNGSGNSFAATRSPLYSAFHIPHWGRGVGWMHEHHIGVSRTARYFTLGERLRGAAEAWFVCHGYGQPAARFLEKLRVVDDGRRPLVAPEGLSPLFPTARPHDRRAGATR